VFIARLFLAWGRLQSLCCKEQFAELQRHNLIHMFKNLSCRSDCNYTKLTKETDQELCVNRQCQKCGGGEASKHKGRLHNHCAAKPGNKRPVMVILTSTNAWFLVFWQAQLWLCLSLCPVCIIQHFNPKKFPSLNVPLFSKISLHFWENIQK
jgi:hypothetical protein